VDGKPFRVTRQEYGTLIELIDCASGISMVIQPGMRIATMNEDKIATPRRQTKRAYSTPHFPGAGAKLPPNMTIE
jgi:hypothetical protein